MTRPHDKTNLFMNAANPHSLTDQEGYNLVLCQVLFDGFVLRGVGARSAPTPHKKNI
jgi:hypothetical protein